MALQAPHLDVAGTADLLDEQSLVEEARANPDAFARLYRLYLPRVHAFARRRTGSSEAAEDICSATFEKALRNLHKFRWRSGGFAPWILRIASNETTAYYRQEGRPNSRRGQLAMSRHHESASEDDLPQVLLGETEQLRVALDQLPPRYQRAIALRYLADLEPDEAAQAMGLAKPALAVVLSRALKALRREIERSTETSEVENV